MGDFVAQLEEAYGSVERYVKYRLNGGTDAEDLIQDICTAAYLQYHQLRDTAAFKAWILTIARNRCNDHFRRKEKIQEVPLDEVPEGKLIYSRLGPAVPSPVEETLDALTEKDRDILRLFYWKQLSLVEISEKLNIPVGTVKSRLHTAKAHFKEQDPYPPKGDHFMTKLPKIMPDYTIARIDAAPFSCRWEELQGWLIVPRVGEKLSWGMYDFPERKRTEYTEIEVIGKAEVHGIEGVEIVAMQFDSADYFRTGSLDRVERRFIAQLTDTHSRYLAETHMEDGIRKCYTFLDGDVFLNNWGFGENNCGNEVNLCAKGILHREGSCVSGTIPREVVDVVGRYCVTIGGKPYDTICVMDIECYNDAVATEQYIDQNGRTVLWRRFNRNDWAIDRFGGKLWSETLPDNEQLIINGETYVHWYDCLSDYIL